MPDDLQNPPPRVAAIDLGKTRVGLAVSDELGLLAHPRPALDGKKRKALLRALVELARDEGIAHFVVGMPLSMSGDAGVAAQRAMRFCQQLCDATGASAELVDERLTSVEAERRLREAGVKGRDAIQKRIDGAAAAVMLQVWLDRRQAEG